jgi:hypothetical protein
MLKMSNYNNRFSLSDYLSSCWLTALICGITLFIISIMLTSCMTYQHHPRLPRCSSDYHLIDNKTIHLVHTSHKWSSYQLELIENITDAFPGYQIHLLEVNTLGVSSNKIMKEVNGTKSNETSKNRSEKTLQDLLRQHPNLLVTHMSYGSIFENSPLFFSWFSLSHQMRNFAIRVLQLWQFGGLSFDLLEYQSQPPKKFRNCSYFAEAKVKSYVRHGHERYENLGDEIVSVDHNGFHMECKIPCHAFFGKVLMKLRKANEKSTPRGILNGPIYTFCRAGVIDKEFCHSKNIIFK